MVRSFQVGTVGSNHRSHTVDIGIGNFFENASPNPYYFGGNERAWTVTYSRPVHMVKVTVSQFELPPFQAYLSVYDGAWVLGAPAPLALGSMTGVSTYEITSNGNSVSIRFEHPTLDKWYTPGKCTFTVVPLSCDDFPGNDYRDGCSGHGECRDFTVTASRPIFECECDDGYFGGDCGQLGVQVSSQLLGSTAWHWNLQVAINAMPDGDTLTIQSPAVLTGTGNRGLVIPPKRITLRGLSPLQTIIDCEGMGRGFILQHAENITGSNLLASNASLTLSSMSIKDCVAETHGSPTRSAAFAWPFAVLPYAADISGKGAALYVQTTASLTVKDVIIENSTAGVLRGGAVYLSRMEQPAHFEDVMLANSTFGGGLMVQNVSTTLKRSFLYGNKPAHDTVDETLDLDLMCSGPGALVSYSGSLLANEQQSFNCYCKADCTRFLVTTPTVNTATLISSKLVIQGAGLANGDDSDAVTFVVATAGSSGTSLPCVPTFVRPHLVVCELGSTGPALSAAAVSLSVTRHDGKYTSSAVFKSSGIEAEIVAGLNATTENGGTARIKLRLRSKPLSDVVVPVSSGIDANGTTIAVASALELWFTPVDWQQWKYITLTGIDDMVVRGLVPYTVDLGPSASEGEMLYQDGGVWQSGPNLVPASLNVASLSYVNQPFGCPQISMVVNASGTGCECAAGFTAIPDGPDQRFVCAKCAGGHYKPSQGNGPCNQCPGDINKMVGTLDVHVTHVHVTVEDCKCRPGYFASLGTHGASLMCQVCKADESSCDGWGYSVNDMGVKPGFWRTAANPEEPVGFMVPCTTPQHCVGAANMTRDDMCKNSSTYGYQCFGCQPKFGRTAGLCSECPAAGLHGLIMQIVWVALAFIAPAFLFGVTKPPGHEDSFKPYPLSVGLVKIFISHMQMRLVLNDLYPAWSPVTSTTFDAMGSLASFYFAKFEPTDCFLSDQTSSDRFYTKFLISISIPAVIIPIVILFGVMYWCRNPFKVHAPHPNAPGAWEWQEVSQAMRAWCVNMVIGTAWIAYPSVIHAAFAVLVCDKDSTADGEPLPPRFSYLRVEKSIYCDDEALAPFQIGGVAVLVLMGLGLPLLLAKLVHMFRLHLGVITVKRRIGLLFIGYRPSCKYWESWVMLRTTLLITIASTISNLIVRISVAALFLQVCLAVHVLQSPYEPNWVMASRLESVSLASTILIFMVALLQAGIDMDRPSMPLEVVVLSLSGMAGLFILLVMCMQIYVDFSHVPRTNVAGRFLMNSAFGGRGLVSVAPGPGGGGGAGPAGGPSSNVASIKKRLGLKAHLKNMSMARKLAAFGGGAQSADTEVDESPAAESANMAEEIMYLSKEKELNQQLEALKLELGAVKRRENLTSIMSKMARSGVRPARIPPSSAMAELRKGIALMGGFNFKPKPEGIDWPEGVECTAMQTEAVDIREEGDLDPAETDELMRLYLQEEQAEDQAEEQPEEQPEEEQPEEEQPEPEPEPDPEPEPEPEPERNPLPPLNPLPPKASVRQLDFMRVFKDPMQNKQEKTDDSDEEVPHDSLEDVALDDGIDARDKVSDAMMKKFQARGGDAMEFVAARDQITASSTNMRHLKTAIANVRAGHKDWWIETDDHVDTKSTLGSAAVGTIDYPAVKLD